MSDPLRKVVDAFVALFRALPQCRSVEVRQYGTGPEIVISGDTETATQDFARRLGVDLKTVCNGYGKNPATSEWSDGSLTTLAGNHSLVITVTGPHRPIKEPKKISGRKVDSAVALANDALSEVR